MLAATTPTSSASSLDPISPKAVEKTCGGNPSEFPNADSPTLVCASCATRRSVTTVSAARCPEGRCYIRALCAQITFCLRQLVCTVSHSMHTRLWLYSIVTHCTVTHEEITWQHLSSRSPVAFSDGGSPLSHGISCEPPWYHRSLYALSSSLPRRYAALPHRGQRMACAYALARPTWGGRAAHRSAFLPRTPVHCCALRSEVAPHAMRRRICPALHQSVPHLCTHTQHCVVPSSVSCAQRKEPPLEADAIRAPTRLSLPPSAVAPQ